MPDPHRRRPRVILHAMKGEARPRDGDDAFDDAEREPFLLEERALLDVELEIGADRAWHTRLGAEVADAPELVDEADAVLVAGVVRASLCDLAPPAAARDHRGRQPRAFP